MTATTCMLARRSTRAGLCVTAASLVLYASPALAEPNATERATAEALFQQGTDLMTAGQHAKACEKFEGSQQLDPALGTLLRLADCLDRTGKTAGAWAMFREAVSLARSRNEPERMRVANERALDLEKRLSRLELRIDAKNRIAGLEIRLNGVLMPRATWDSAFTVDPGPQRIEASAPGRLPWAGSLNVGEGPTIASVEVPALAVKTDTSSSSAAVNLNVEPAAGGQGNTQRTIGYVVGGLGVMGLATGGYFSYRAFDLNRKSLEQCRSDDPNACTPEGKDRRDSAKSAATGATVAVAAGVALLATGIVLIVRAPRSEQAHGLFHNVRLTASPSLQGGSVRLQGIW